MINRVVLVGRLTKEPELRTTPSGAKVCQYTLAVNRTRKAEGQPDADFINCVTWNRQAETMAQYLDKGFSYKEYDRSELDYKAEKVCQMLENGYTDREIIDKLNVKNNFVYCIRTKRTYKNISNKYNF